MAEAFPSLSPADLTARLLASANNAWFVEQGRGVVDQYFNPIYNASYLDERCWNEGTVNEFCHTYSLEWGHGIMDLEAALQPIGLLRVTFGSDLQTAQRVTLAEASFSAPSGLSQSLREALNVDLTVFDDLNGNFIVSAASFVTTRVQPRLSERMLVKFAAQEQTTAPSFIPGSDMSFTASNVATEDGLPASFAFQSGSFDTGWITKFGFSGSDLPQTFGGLQTVDVVNPIGFAGLMSGSGYGSVGRNAGLFGNVEVFGFSGENRNTDDGSISGVGVRTSYTFGPTAIQVSTSLAAEEGSYLGLAGNSDVWFGDQTEIVASQVAFSHDLGEGLKLLASAEIGVVDNGESGALVEDSERASYSGFAVGIEKAKVFDGHDRLNLWFSQPMHVEDYDVTFRLASGRTKDGEILYESYRRNLTPEARQLDLGVSYAISDPLGRTKGAIGIVQSFNSENVSGASDTSVAARFSHQF